MIRELESKRLTEMEKRNINLAQTSKLIEVLRSIEECETIEDAKAVVKKELELTIGKTDKAQSNLDKITAQINELREGK